MSISQCCRSKCSVIGRRVIPLATCILNRLGIITEVGYSILNGILSPEQAIEKYLKRAM